MLITPNEKTRFTKALQEAGKFKSHDAVFQAIEDFWMRKYKNKIPEKMETFMSKNGLAYQLGKIEESEGMVFIAVPSTFFNCGYEILQTKIKK